MNYLRDAWKKTFCYTGRVSRKDYWMAVLWYAISVLISGVVAILFKLPMGLPFFVQEVILGWLFYIIILALVLYVMCSFFVFLALGVRRIHDIGLSGWWMLVTLIPFIGGIVVFIFTLIKGNAGDNKYGSDPLGSVVVSTPTVQ
jgi:uncharacterized membrane protein YhaH (DUF805 family)